jgi:hypothetical protein
LGRRLFVSQLVGQLQDPGARNDVAVFGESAEEVRVLINRIVAVLAHAEALLRQVVNVAIVAIAVEEVFAPGDPVAALQPIAAHVAFDALPDLLDDTDDLVAQDTREGVGPSALVGVNVRTADGRHLHPHQNLARLHRAQRIFLEHERRVRRLAHGCLGGAHQAALRLAGRPRQGLFNQASSRPLRANSKTLWLFSPPPAARSA